MNNSKISVRYAKAFFALAQEKNSLKSVSEDVNLLLDVHSDPNFRILLTDPIISTSEKKQIFKNIFSGKLNDLTLNFLELITEKGREVFLNIMCLNFLGLYRKHLGIEAASITTTEKLNSEVKEKIKGFVEEYFKTKVEFAEKTNKDLIGGFIIRVGDKQLDASILRKLEDTKKSLLTAKI